MVDSKEYHILIFVLYIYIYIILQKRISCNQWHIEVWRFTRWLDTNDFVCFIGWFHSIHHTVSCKKVSPKIILSDELILILNLIQLEPLDFHICNIRKIFNKLLVPYLVLGCPKYSPLCKINYKFYIKMQIALFKFDWNSLSPSNFYFIQLSFLNFKFIQFRFFIQFQFHWKIIVKYAIN